MSNITKFFRPLLITSAIVFASFSTTAVARELSKPVKTDLVAVIGQALTSQLNTMAIELNREIKKSINENLLAIGLELSKETPIEAMRKNVNKTSDQ